MQTTMVTDIEKKYDGLKQCLNGNWFAGSHQIHTPRELVEEILSQIPDLSNNKTVLVLFNLEFVISLVYNNGVNTSNITFYSDHENKTKLARRIGVNVIETLENNNMKFDVVVGNPPYQKSNNEAKRWTLWEQFVKKSFQISEMICMVTPQSITSPGPFSLIKDNLVVLNTDVSKHFSVGSTFCYFIATPNVKTVSTKIKTDADQFNICVSSLPFLPFHINQKTIDQINFLVANEKHIWKRGELHTSKKELFSDDGKFSVMHTNAQELKTNFIHPNKDKIRVCVSLSGYPTFKVIQGRYASQACFWTEFNSIEEANEFAAKCNAESVQEILKTFKWSGWNSKEVIQCL